MRFHPPGMSICSSPRLGEFQLFFSTQLRHHLLQEAFTDPQAGQPLPQGLRCPLGWLQSSYLDSDYPRVRSPAPFDSKFRKTKAARIFLGSERAFLFSISEFSPLISVAWHTVGGQ